MRAVSDGQRQIESLQRKVAHQASVIETYEAANTLYKRLRHVPMVRRVAHWASARALTRGRGGLVIREHIESSAGRSPLVGVCNPRWAGGVREATFAICPDVVEISEIFDRSTAARAALSVTKYYPDKVMLSGHPTGYDLLAEEIKRRSPSTRIYAYVHSSFAWFDEHPAENPVFDRYLALQRAGVIERIGFCKRDVARFISRLGVDTAVVMNPFSHAASRHELSRDGVIRIGVWGKSLWHRNLLNQIVAALMVEGAEVHVNEYIPHAFLDETRIVAHGRLPREQYDAVMRTMDVNLYVSFTDCFPMTLIESMVHGIPCVASDTSEVYSFDPALKSDLVVSAIDSPLAIAGRIRAVLQEYPSIQQRIEDYLPVLKIEIDKAIEEFLR